MLNKKNKQKFIWILLFLMSTAFSFALDKRLMNFLLISFMAIVPFLIIFQFSPTIKKDKIIIFIFFIVLFISSLINFNSFRISTLLYTLMFLLTFVYYLKLIYNTPITIDLYIKIIKFIIGAYFVVLLIQQISVFFNFKFILNFNAGTIKEYKLNSLAPEPSHSARFVMVLMYSYIIIKELLIKRKYNLLFDLKSDLFIWIAFLYTMLTMGSSFAIVLLLVFLLKFIEIKKILYLTPFIVFLGLLILNIESHSVERVVHFSKAFFEFDKDLMIQTDLSAAIRVVPFMIYIDSFNLFDITTWIGYGIDYSSYLISVSMPGFIEGGYAAGLIPGFLFDYGLVSFFMLFLIIRKFCLLKVFSFDSAFLFILIFVSGINTQLFWICIFLFTTNKYLIQKSKLSSINV